MSEKPGFVLYKRQKLLFDHLSFEERGELITAIFDYFAGGEALETDNRALSMAFGMIREQLDFDSAAYDEKCRKMSKNAGKRKQAKAINCNQAKTETVTDAEADTDANTASKEKTKTKQPAFEAGDFPSPPPADSVSSEKIIKRGAFKNVCLSDRDYMELKAEFPDDIDKRIDRLSEYMETKGYRYSNHAEVIRRWAKTDHPDRYRNDTEVVDDYDIDAFFEAALERSRRYLEKNGNKNENDNENGNEKEENNSPCG